jgi:hypothetical protein
LNPIIFTKKNFVKNIKVSDDILAFEYILATVCKLYYKSTFVIDDYINLFNTKAELQPAVETVAELRTVGRQGKKKRGVPRSMNINTSKEKDSASKDCFEENNVEANISKENDIAINTPIDAGLDLLE